MWVCGGCFAASETWKATNNGSRGFDEFFLISKFRSFFHPKNPWLLRGIHRQLKLSERSMLESRPGKMKVATPLVQGGKRSGSRGKPRGAFFWGWEAWFISTSHWSTGGWTPRYSQLWKLGNFSKPPTWKEGISARIIYRLESMIPSLSSACSQCIPFYNISFYDSTYTYVQGVYVYIYI